MSDQVIRVENLSKRYRIGKSLQHTNGGVGGLQKLLAPFNYLANTLREAAPDEIFWALKEVSFEVKQGEVMGIVGSNGAGKSTLLKILSRITEPTSGRVLVDGRVGSLLEVGTGFHPELTGRENIFLNGAILGMKRAEISRKFDEIVDFAGTGKFLDTPVKHYSSGMYVRLAFAVAAHLEPEILVVDEVLAVGDAAFQKKCLTKMGEIAKGGRTVLFVSHNMVAIQSLCDRVVWLQDGQKKQEGETAQLISDYLHLNTTLVREQVWPDLETAPGNETVRLHRVQVQPEIGSSVDSISMETPFRIEIEFWNQIPDTELEITLHIYTEQHMIAFSTGSALSPGWGGGDTFSGWTFPKCMSSSGQLVK